MLGQGAEAAAPALLAQAEVFGRDLFGRLFGGELGDCWQGLRAKAEASGEAIRLRLRVASEAPELDALPWEFLHDDQGFLAPDRGVLLSRGAAALPDLAIPSAESGPLGVLVVVSHPLDLPDFRSFEPDEELAVIYLALDKPLRRGQIYLEVVDEASTGEMQRAVMARDYQVVHFIGHGGFDEREGGLLEIEDQVGNTQHLSGARFADLLAGRGVRLVLLSDSLTAQASPPQAYRSVAGALLRRGLPAVVAMQYPILITSARSFYRAVYGALSANRPLDVAVAEGQQALYLERGEAGGDPAWSPLQWATPALFSRGMGDWRLGVDAQDAAPPTPRVELSALGELAVMEHGFVGRRREGRRIRRAFLREEARAALIYGFGGIGKTVLATRVARRLAETERFDGVFGLRARPDLGPDELLRAFNDFFTGHGIDAFDPAMRSPAPLGQKVDALVQVLRQVRLVVILDNCEDWLEVKDGRRHQVAVPELADLLARLIGRLERGSKLLIISRYDFDPLPRGRLVGALLRVPLGELSRGEAARLMGRLPGLRETDYGTRLRVFEAVGGHPFVLNLFAERAARDGLDYALADVRTVRREAEEVGQLLLGQIVGDLSAGARWLLEQASALRRAGPREAMEALAGTHRIGAELEELMDWGLVVQAHIEDELCAEPETRFGMHALVRDYAAERLGKEDTWRGALLALARFYTDQNRLETLDYRNVQVFNLLEGRHYYFQAGEIDQAVTEPLVRWGLLDTARELNRETAEHAKGKVRAAALHHWGIVEQAQGNYAEAVRLSEQSRQVLEELGDKSGVASSLGQMGKLAQAQGRQRDAMGYYLQALAIFQALNSPYAQLAMRDLASVRAEVGESQFAAWWEDLSAELGELGPPPEGDATPDGENQPQGVSLDQFLQQIEEATIEAMTQGDAAQRGQLWEALGRLRGQAAGQAELAGLVVFLDAVCGVLEGSQAGEMELEAPFDAAWRRIQEGISGGG